MFMEGAGSTEAADGKIAQLLGVDVPSSAEERVEHFWQQVETNMREGKVRLLFVADELPKELRCLIEFLNKHFRTIEVLGVELRQYVGEGVRALVPRVIGQTEVTRERKERAPGASPARGQVTKEEFLASCDGKSAEFFATVIEAAEREPYEVRWGSKGFSLRLPLDGKLVSVFYGFPGSDSLPVPYFEVYIDFLKQEEHRKLLAGLVDHLNGFQRVTDKTSRCLLGPSSQADTAAVAEAVVRFAELAAP
jgi:hypothetical protein